MLEIVKEDKERENPGVAERPCEHVTFTERRTCMPTREQTEKNLTLEKQSIYYILKDQILIGKNKLPQYQKFPQKGREKETPI